MSEIVHISHHALEEETYSKTILGFWIYLMTDCVLFGTLFATYAVLHNNTNGGPSAAELFSLPFALAETLILLTSSFTCGLVLLAKRNYQKIHAMALLGVTLLLGMAFLALELTEFTHLVREGNSWQRSAFLSAFFTLVGTHGLHISFGLLWIIVLIFQLFFNGFTAAVIRRITCFALFWHFLDLIWVFIFTVVYLMGAQ
jgi:cytochrome o ubiquinol oxidase subunit 3